MPFAGQTAENEVPGGAASRSLSGFPQMLRRPGAASRPPAACSSTAMDVHTPELQAHYEFARWSLEASRETELALRTLRAAAASATHRAVFREPVCDVRERNADTDPGEIEQVVFVPQQIAGRPQSRAIARRSLLVSGSYRCLCAQQLYQRAVRCW